MFRVQAWFVQFFEGEVGRVFPLDGSVRVVPTTTRRKRLNREWTRGIPLLARETSVGHTVPDVIARGKRLTHV